VKQLEEFKEVAHCGGQYVVSIKMSDDDHAQIQLGIRHSRPVPAAFAAVYALPQGIPVGTIQLGGIGQPWNPAPFPGCQPIFIASDSHGMFGHQCPGCKGYWRSKSSPSRWPITCPYCGLRAEMNHFLTEGQLRYLQACCNLIGDAMEAGEAGEFVIDMDKVADATGKECEKPDFYYAEESQQNNYKCAACGDINDILGRYGYCSCCGTFNGITELEKDIERIKQNIQVGQEFEAASKDAVGAFDSFSRQIAKQLVLRVPMTPARQKQWSRKLFHNLASSANELAAVFDIDMFKRMKKEDISFAELMFHRRHVYEHNGGEVDDKYIRDSGDTSVRPKQVIRENRESATRIADVVLKLATNLHDGFHQIFSPIKTAVQIHKQ